MVAECTLKRLGNLPFDFDGTCGTFMIDGVPTILLCFYRGGSRKCRSLIRRNDGALRDINDFLFDSEFEIDKIDILDTKHAHYGEIVNYQGFPLILGGHNNKLEVLNTIENQPRWVEETDYPYANK